MKTYGQRPGALPRAAARLGFGVDQGQMAIVMRGPKREMMNKAEAKERSRHESEQRRHGEQQAQQRSAPMLMMAREMGRQSRWAALRTYATTPAQH